MHAVFGGGDLADPLWIINSHQASWILTFVDSNAVWPVACVSANDVALVITNDAWVVANDVRNVLLSVVWNGLGVVTNGAVDIVTKVVAWVDTDIDVVGSGQQLQTRHVFIQFVKTTWLVLQYCVNATQYWSVRRFRQPSKWTER